jgi:flagellar hook-associated protein FlgK
MAMQETQAILDSVHQFYADSFSQLVTLTLAMLGFIGVLVPVLLTIYQQRLFKLEQREVMGSLRTQLDAINVEHIKLLEQKFDDREKLSQQRMEAQVGLLQREIAKAQGSTFHVQANQSIASKQYPAAFESLLDAAIKYVDAQNESNLGRVLTLLTHNTLPHLDSSHFEYRGEMWERQLQKANAGIAEVNVNGRFTDAHNQFKAAVKAAKARTPAPAPPVP